MKASVRRARKILTIAVAVLGGASGPTMAQDLPVEPYKANDKGILVAEVQFDAQGKVAACRVVRSNVPYPLEASTVDYIRRKWVNEAFAGAVAYFPLTFDQLPWYAKAWDNGLVPPPNLLSPGDPDRNLKLRVTFGPAGWVQRITIQEASGIQLVDQQTAIWVKVHWHSDAYAGQTVDVPFEFKSPASPRPVVVKTPPPKPKPAPEEEAPPAVRVQ
jgi:hypothetical protein